MTERKAEQIRETTDTCLSIFSGCEKPEQMIKICVKKFSIMLGIQIRLLHVLETRFTLILSSR